MAVFLKEISEYLLQNGVLNFAFQLEEITVFYFFYARVNSEYIFSKFVPIGMQVYISLWELSQQIMN